jgi:site-specific recombinase XerD
MTNEEVFFKAKEEFKLRGLSPNTADEYLRSLKFFLEYHQNRPLEEMGESEIRAFLLYKIDSGKATGTVNIYNSALRFIFCAVMGRNLNIRMIPRKHQYRELPDILSKSEVARFFNVIDNLRDRTMFETIYGAGLRLSEATYLRVQDIDSEQMRIFVHQGKGGKDRYTILSQRNLELLREYWKQYRPNHPDGYLFYPRMQRSKVLTPRSVINAFAKYRNAANLPDTFTVHSLRHCFATHLLDAGADVCYIKELLGHTFIQTTAFYLHLKNTSANITSPLDTLPKKPGRKPKVNPNA